MAVNKISLNKVDSQNVSQIVIQPDYPVEDAANQSDVVNHLGTQLNTTTFTNPTSTFFTSLEEGSLIEGDIAALTDRSLAHVNSPRFTASNVVIQFELLNSYELDLQSYIVANQNEWDAGPKGWTLEGSNDENTWELLDQVSTHPLGFAQTRIYNCETRLGFFKFFRFRNFTWNATDRRIGEFLFFGKLRNLTTGQAAIEFTKDIFASYPSISSNARDKNQILRYDGSYWEPRTRFPYEVQKLNLSADYTIASAYKPTFYIVSPNGANRTITLPSTPNKDDVIKIKNVDGLFDLTVEESPGDSSPVVMSNSGKLQYEFVYDGIEWQVTG